jgi:signal transduction histidine kinase
MALLTLPLVLAGTHPLVAQPPHAAPRAITEGQAVPAAPPSPDSLRAPATAANVLMLWDVALQSPYVTTSRQAFELALSAAVRRPVTIFDETLDLDRFPEPAQQGRLQSLLVDKYRQRPIDLIVSTGQYSLSAARRVRGALPGPPGVDSIPIVYAFDDPGRPADPASFPRGPAITGLVLASAELETARRIGALMPGLRTLVVVGSLPEQANLLVQEVRQALGGAVQYVPLVNPTPDALRRVIDTLPRPAAMLLYRVLRDTDGTGWLPVAYLRRISADSPIPIFSSFPAYLGEGIVGGALRDPARDGALFGELVARRLNGVAADSMPPQRVRITEDAYDWSLLQRYDLKARALPPGARLIRKPQRVWEEYPRTTLVVLLLLAALTAVVALLLRSGRRLARVSRERRQLAQHLLTVQEAERQRIARDLHDDVCQEMSAIAVELDAREHDLVPPGGDRRVRGHPPLADRLRTLVERTRVVSHGLHAEPLAYMKLPQVLAHEAEALCGRHHIACTVRLHDSGEAVPPAMATNVYRIAMEALHNMARHASASQCTVNIVRGDHDFTLTIADNGVGFSGAPRGGLGVLSMRERAMALGGRLQVASEPFRGTTVTLVVPVPAATHGVADHQMDHVTAEPA